MIKLSAPVIVEGKYDKITLENVIDALIIPTNGFGIFKDKEKRELIRTLAKRFGVVVITDSDSAGNLIRGHIKGIVGSSKITNVYIPQIRGKEKRKSKAGKEGLLGVEGMSTEALTEAFRKYGVTAKAVEENLPKITKTQLYETGLSGTENSRENRKSLLRYLNLPVNLTANGMLEVFNTIYTKEEFCEVISGWQDHQIKS